jgi:membrane protein required for colicin V production
MIVDVVVAIVLILSALIALIRGFIRETLTIVGVVGGLVAAYFGGALLSPIVYGWFGVDETAEEPARLFDVIPYSMVADALSYGLIFISVVIVLSLASHVLAESAKSIGLGVVDRILGAGFGIARGVLLVALMYLPFYLLLDDDTKKSWFEQSASHPYLEKSAAVIASYIPQDTIDKIEQDAGKLTDAVQQKEAVDGVIDRVTGEGAQDPAETPQAPQANPEAAPAVNPQVPPAEEDSGYSEQFRQKMDKMFEEQNGAQVPPATTTPGAPAQEQTP